MHGDQAVFEGTSGVIIPKALCEIARVSPPLLLKQSSGDLMGEAEWRRAVQVLHFIGTPDCGLEARINGLVLLPSPGKGRDQPRGGPLSGAHGTN
jgi:hypothetical protein